jgi:acyl-CoA synthetase (AMP-forming)/AMP-acid ligase II
MNFAEIFRLHARHRPTKPALVEGDRVITYAELDRTLDGICHALAAAGVARGQLLGVGLGDTARHVMLLLALTRLGAVTLPVDCRWSAEEKANVLVHFGAGLLLTEAPVTGIAAPQLLEDAAWYAGSDRPYLDPLVTYDSPMVLSLSSGTTGLPKGPRVSQRTFENRFPVHWLDVGFTSHDRFVSATPLYFGGGRAFALSMLVAGGTVLMFPPPYSPEELLDYVARERGNSIFLVPTLLRRLLQVDRPAPMLPTVEKLISSGSALFGDEKTAIRARLSPCLIELYSATEGGSISVLGPEEFAAHPDSVGRACFRVELQIVDEEHRPLPTGEIGRLRYRSPASATEYYVGDSSAAFRDGWFYPGDLAMLNQAGFLFLRGRAKDMIIRGGVNIYPGDIENVLLGIDGIVDAAVVGVPSPILGEEVVAFVVQSADVTEATMLAACRAHLAPFKVPRSIVVVDALPKHAGGKVLRDELVKLAQAGARPAPAGGT